MSTDSGATRELVEWTKAGPKTWRAHTDGAALVTELQASGKKPRQTHKTFATEEEARSALEKAAREKMVAGFVYVRDPARATNGELLFAMRTPGGGARCSPSQLPVQRKSARRGATSADRRCMVCATSRSDTQRTLGRTAAVAPYRHAMRPNSCS